MSSMWSLELAFLFLSLFCWVISIWTPEGWLQEILRSIWQVPEAWGAWRFHQPHQDCRAPSLPHLQVWRWADQPEGVRGPHEGRTERHLLHHWRKHCCSVFLSILGDPPQEGNRSAVHGCLSYLVTASFIEFSKLTHYDSLTIMDPCCWFSSNHVVGFPTIQDASPFRCLHYPSLSKNAQLPFTYGQLVDEVHDWMVGTCWHCLLATVKWVKCKVLLRARGWPNWWVCNSAAEGVRWQEAEEHHQGGSRHRWRGWEEEDRGTESGIWAIDQTHEGGTWIGLLVWAFLNDILSGRVLKILSLYATALKHIKTMYGSGRFCFFLTTRHAAESGAWRQGGEGPRQLSHGRLLVCWPPPSTVGLPTWSASWKLKPFVTTPWLPIWSLRRLWKWTQSIPLWLSLSSWVQLVQLFFNWMRLSVHSWPYCPKQERN